MSFDQVWRNRVDAEIDGVVVHFIGKEDLIENKRQVGRLIDLADVEELTRRPEATELRIPAESERDS
jgi:predicted nucleotidyltransferase